MPKVDKFVAMAKLFFDRLPKSATLEITPEQLDRVEELLLESFPQLDIPATHTFVDGLYIREATLPKGSLILGHHHTTEHWCVVLTGRMTIINPDRSVTEIIAPCAFAGGLGRKVAYIYEDLRMQNIHTVNWHDKSRDPLMFEEFLYRKTDAFRKFEGSQKKPALVEV